MKKASTRVHTTHTQADIGTMLVKKGLRRTKERALALSTLVRLHTPCSVETLQTEVGDAVNKVTLYRMLEQFADAGLIERVAQPDGVRRYEYQSEHHHHITCTGCGTRERVSVPEGTLTRAVAKSAPSFSAVTTHTLEFYGVCRECDN